MRFNLLRVTFYGVSLSAAAALSGCMDGGAVLAEESGRLTRTNGLGLREVPSHLKRRIYGSGRCLK